ncbi:vacuolar protein sorting/targeting protein 10 [Macrophomina phaseolina]|uniref:Vacuolar protein sorting/targeting protein 10 n=1 Tax=Macrophomina phaseolina TaxID=35725 RepID=A0ABQ8GMF6_9PEZI|nr:vacuolar protein sorting/targeting protein 10 [Macrophomina phaseolina]
MILSKAVWLSALLAIGVVAKSDDPTIKKHKFETPPTGLFFFDDTETALTIEYGNSKVWRTTNAGLEWERIEKPLGENQVAAILHHPFNNKVAVALGKEKKHWYTKDQGETWRVFETDAGASPHSPISWHTDDPERVLFHGADRCDWFGGCVGKTWYTTNGFEHFKPLIDSRKTCMWARSTDVFTTGDSATDKNRILCVTEGKFSKERKDYRLIYTDNFGDDFTEPPLSEGRTVPGVAHLASAKGYIVAAAKSEGTDEMALYVTDDTRTWHRAQFGQHKLQEDAYTILESTNYSIQVDVMSSSLTDMGSLFTSNSNGTYFTRNIDHTNRNEDGFVDFEKITGIQGIILVNVVKNYEAIEKNPLFESKKIASKISFDDGRTWHDLKTEKDHILQVHSYTEQHNSGKVFSSPAPGLVMAIGNTGDTLKPYKEGDLWTSDDAGMTWHRALEGPHKYEFGDKGSLLVAIKDGEETNKVKYSINHGKEWKTTELPDSVLAHELTTIPDSTGIKFVLVASSKSKEEWSIYTLDFAGIHERKCKDDDFELWHARKDEDGKPGCIMGRKQSFRRRKPDADCFIMDEFVDPEPKWETCKCTKEDYECDFNFVRKDGECVQAGPLIVPDGQCKNGEEKFKGSSGWRLIPGNKCEKDGGVELDKPVERKCEESKKPVASGKVVPTFHRFEKSADFREYYYLERAESTNSEESDETIVMRDDENTVWITHDHGKTWKRAVDEPIIEIYPHQYFNDIVYFLTADKKVYYSKNRGKEGSIHSFNAPKPPAKDRVQKMGFHPHEKEWILWTGREDCESSQVDCHNAAYKSTKGGMEGSWDPMLQFVQKCQFVWREERVDSEQLVFCEQYANEDTSNPLQLLSSTDWFETKKVHYEDVANFATMAEFIIVAKKTEDHKWLKVDVSIDGKTFAEAQFPHKFNLEHRQAYTVLDSSTHAVFLHVTMNNEKDQEYGSILKSNSNGTEYVLSIAKVNRNEDGYVDFEKMQGLEGAALINVVANADEVDKGGKKKLKSMITHNDGAEWALIPPPEKDSDNSKYPCSGKLDKCSLHIHGYTERKDPRDTFSSPSAVGLMMGVGNVGEYLGRYGEANTFVTRDGGITWHEVMKGTFMWEYGDQGSIIVIVKEGDPTDMIHYSLDEGNSWEPFKFTTDGPIIIDSISTVPSDTSKNFLLWGRKNKNLITINLDFSGLYDRVCDLDEEDPTGGDYDLWEPKHPMQDENCLFGHVAQYHRKKLKAECWNGHDIQKLHDIKKNCTCTRADFECDYNFERDENDGTCKLVPGLDPVPNDAVCKNPNVIEYNHVTGYRRIPLTTCQGGKELDLTAGTRPCPNKEEEYNRKHGVSGVAIFFAVLIPFAAAGAIGWYVWRNWDGKFGQIRLGDSQPSFDSNSRLVAWPVAAVSGLIAVLAAVPLLAGSLWRSISNRFGGGGSYYGRTYTTRGSFARGDYAVVDPDEGELLGEDSDEEV